MAYICIIESDTSHAREYSVDWTRSAKKCGDQFGRCEFGETVTLKDNKGRIISVAKYNPEKKNIILVNLLNKGGIASMKTYITNIDGKWYAFEGDTNKNEVYSIGSDNPKYGGQWFARWTDSGIKYVSSPSTSRSGAYKKACRNGNYGGEV